MSTEKKPVAFRLPEDTRQELEAYRKERGISKSDAGRRLLEEGLDVRTSEEDERTRSTTALSAEYAQQFLMMLASTLTALAVLVTAVWIASTFAIDKSFSSLFVLTAWLVAFVANAPIFYRMLREFRMESGGGE